MAWVVIRVDRTLERDTRGLEARKLPGATVGAPRPPLWKLDVAEAIPAAVQGCFAEEVLDVPNVLPESLGFSIRLFDGLGTSDVTIL